VAWESECEPHSVERMGSIYCREIDKMWVVNAVIQKLLAFERHTDFLHTLHSKTCCDRQND